MSNKDLKKNKPKTIVSAEVPTLDAEALAEIAEREDRTVSSLRPAAVRG